MQTRKEKAEINRMLGSHGLGQLCDGTGLLAQLGYLVQDHEHFRSLLARCPPEDRGTMYATLAAYLRFNAHTLDSYEAETKRLAERQQLPTVEPDGSYKEFKPSTGAIASVQKALETDCGTVHLVLTCRKCTKGETFTAYRKADAVAHARAAGWVYDTFGETGSEICPDCPAGVNIQWKKTA